MNGLLRFLGNGNAFNVERGNTSAYYKNNGTLFLFDCGWSVFQTLVNKNILSDVKSVLIAITHLHCDHTGSLAGLIDYCGYVLKTKPVVVALDSKIVDLLSLQGIILNDDYTMLAISEQKKCYFDVEGSEIISVEPIKVVHSAKFTNCGYIVQFGEKSIYYSGDSNDIPEEVMSQIENIEEIYQDTANYDYVGKQHMSLRKLEEKIPVTLRNKFFCMHIDQAFNEEDATKIGFNVTQNI